MAVGVAGGAKPSPLDVSKGCSQLAVLLHVLHMYSHAAEYPATVYKRADAIPWNLSPVVPSASSASAAISHEGEQIFRDDESTYAGALAASSGRQAERPTLIKTLGLRCDKNRGGGKGEPESGIALDPLTEDRLFWFNLCCIKLLALEKKDV